MGYYTEYSLEVVEGPSLLIEKFREENYNAAFAFDESGDPSDDCKWYDHHTDMISFSKQYPDAVFKLIGIGESPGDLWHKYYQNGKYQECKAKVVFDEFDASKLK